MHCIIVRRGDYQQYEVLYKAFGARVPVVWDRRRGERRDLNRPSEAAAPPTPERRSTTPPSWRALGFVVVDR